MLRRLHRLLGMSLGIWFAISALTGSILVFGHNIEAWLYPQLWRVQTSGSPEVDKALAAVREQFPTAELVRLYMPQSDNESMRVHIISDQLIEVFVDPYSAKLLGSRGETSGLVGWLRTLHVNLFGGETGELVVGVAAITVTSLLVCGLLLAFRSHSYRSAVSIKHETRARAAHWFRLHRMLGIVTIPVVLISVITGIMLVFHQATEKLFLTVLGGPHKLPQPQVVVPIDTSPMPVAQQLASAQSALPEARLVTYSFPLAPNAPAMVRLAFAENPHPNGRSFVAIDPYTSRVLQVHDWRLAGLGIRAADYKYPLHTGVAFGLPGQILILSVGFVPLVLCVSGCYQWWYKRRMRAARRDFNANRVSV